jgi:YidC/Oxa1 family membrane protein insertase
MMINIALFGVVVVAQTSMHLDRFWDQKTILLQNSWIPWMLAAGSIAILVYLCAAFSLTTTRESTKQNPRQLLNVALVWLLCAVLAIVDIAWLFHAYPDLHPARLIGGILLLLAVVFGSPFSDNIPITTNMPTDHALYAVSMSLIAFVVFLANPIGLYVSSSDFIGGVYNLAGTLLMFALIAVLGATALYLLLDTAARKILTLLIVFLAVIIVGYSALGVKGAGIMSQFILPLPNGLLRTGREIALESTILLLIFGVTSYATVRHRQNVTYAVAAMLAASLCLTVTDLYLAKGDKFVASKELPEDHADIVSFSTERNILVLMLDGFPGGYLHRIMEEVPEILREYDGFTWFPNTVTTNADTLGAIATLAGGPRYKPDKINSRNYDSVGSAIHESYGVYIDAFMPKGYQITYVNPTFAGGCDTFRKEIHCSETFPYGVYYHNKEEPDVPLLQGDSHVPWIMAMVSVLQAAPFFLKSWLYDNGGYHGANPTVVRQTAANSLKVREWGFLRVLSRESSAHSRSKTLKFIQLSIPHPPNALDAHCKMEPGQSTVFTEAVCALKEIGTLLLRLQETGIYDVTKIVVVSDHGWYVDNPLFPRDFEKTVPKWQGWLSIPGIAHPLLMVKDFGMRGTFRRSNTFLSNSDVPSLVCSAIEACRDVEPDPTKTNTSERTLTFSIIRYPPEEVQAKKFDIVTTFEVRNNIFDPQNWKRVN